MPHAEIRSKQAILTLSQLHAELAGKFLENRNAGVKIKTAMMQVEAVLQMLQPGFSVAAIAAKRRWRLRHNTARPDIVTADQAQPVDPLGVGEVGCL